MIAALQLATLPMNASKLEYYARACKSKDITLIVLGEYVLNNFFKQLEVMPKAMIKEQSLNKIKTIQNICTEYNLTIIAPIVRFVDGKITKSILKATPKSLRYFDQFFYINYAHWNEEKFFAQTKQSYILPTFVHEGFKYAVIMGFEMNFDYIWQEVHKQKVDIVLMPSVCTFDSIKRWDELIRSRAFTYNVYVLRVNRIGSYKQDNQDWVFYGHSSFTDPHGNTCECLNDEEAMLVVNASKQKLKEARNLWGFRKILNKKGIL